MRIISVSILLVALMVGGCISIDKAIVEDITLPNGMAGISVDCGMYGWSGCFVEAGNRCPYGYLIHERTLYENMETKVPVDPMPGQSALSMIPMRSEYEAGKYMIISCKSSNPSG